MRTTLTLDDDVAVLLERVRADRKLTLKEAVNEGLRRGLPVLGETHRPRRRQYTRPEDVGRSLVGNLDDMHEVLAVAEGEAYR